MGTWKAAETTLALLHEPSSLNAPSDSLLVAQLRVRHEGLVESRAEVGGVALGPVFAQVEEF